MENKVILGIQAKLSGLRCHKQMPYRTYSGELDATTTIMSTENYMEQMECKFTWINKGLVDPNLFPQSMIQFKETSIDLFCEDVYGDLRKMILTIIRDIHKQEFEKVLDTAHEIMCFTDQRRMR